MSSTELLKDELSCWLVHDHAHIECPQFGNSGRVLAAAGYRPIGAATGAWHREPGTMSGYGVPVSLGERAGGEQCPQCGESDLRPYGNGSKWACPRCYFIVPCCEGGELAVRPLGQCGAGSAEG